MNMGKTLWSMLILKKAEKAKQVKANQSAVSRVGEYIVQLIILTIIAAMMPDHQDTTLNRRQII